MRLIDADALIEQFGEYIECNRDHNAYANNWCADVCEVLRDTIVKVAPTIEARPVVRVAARPLEEWHEDYGDVLWWKFPIEEPPYVGSPLDCNWSGYHTHWTPIEVPEPPNGGADMRTKEGE